MTPTQIARPTTNDLWASAKAEMSKDDQKNIDFDGSDKLDNLSDLLQLTEKSRQECIKKRWRYTRKSGETVIFVDLFGKIVKWIDLFKQVGDMAVQYDPVHAALPWAGIRFLVQIAINDSDKFAFVVESAASIGEIICRYAVFEAVYLQHPSAAADELKRALVKFYAAIMIYLSKVKSYFEQNSAKKRPEYTKEATNALTAEICLLHVLSAVDNQTTRRLLSKYGQDSLNSALSHDFRHYSTVYWAPHCQLAANRRTADVLNDLLCHFFSNDSDPGSAVMIWARLIKESLDDYSIEWELKERLKDTSAKEDGGLFIASCFDLQEFARIQAKFGDNIVNTQGRTPLEVAIRYGSCDVVSILLKDKLTMISEEVVKAATGNGGSGKDVMMLLLEQRGADVVITEEVVKAAAKNGGSGKDVMTLLLEQRGADVVITKEVVKAAAGNEGSGKDVMTLLLEQRGADVMVTEEVVKAAAGNEESGKDVMMLLLEQRRADVVITEQVVKTAATCGQDEVLKIIEEHFKISPSKEEWLIAQFYNAAKFGKEDTIQKLLAQEVQPDLKNSRHVSPLWISAANGHLRVVQELLCTKIVDVNAKSISGRPPIFWAAAKGHEDIVRLLLEAGADRTPEDIDGETPLSMAKKNGRDKIAKMLSGE